MKRIPLLVISLFLLFCARAMSQPCRDVAAGQEQTAAQFERRHSSDATRQAISKNYDHERWTITDTGPVARDVVRTSHWWMSLPAFPFDQSDLVVVARIQSGRTYISNDGTGVYSEFAARIRDVIADKTGSSITEDSLVCIDVPGGTVSFASGRVRRFLVAYKELPSAGQLLLLFLRRQTSGVSYAVTLSYDVTGRTVRAIPGIPPFATYDGMDTDSFLALVTAESKR